MHKIFLYIIYSSIILIYTLCSFCKGILSHKDLHPHTEISSEIQDISEKKNITSYASHQLAHLSSSPWRAWKLVQRKLVVGTFSYQGRHKEWPHQLSNWFNHQTNKKLKPVLQMWPSVNLTLFDSHCRKRWLVWCYDWITHKIMSVEQT